MHTLLFYLEKLKDKRKSRQLFVSFCSFNAVGTSTVARWLKTVLHLSGIDTSVFKAHSFRGASASAAFNKGCSVQQIQRLGTGHGFVTSISFIYGEITPMMPLILQKLF